MADVLSRRPIDLIGNEMERMMRTFFGRPQYLVSGEGFWHPPVDIHLTDKPILVRIDIPGIDPEKVDISIEDNRLLVKGKRESCEDAAKDEQAPMALLEPNEQVVARMLAQGLTNEQIAARLGFRDKRTISRTNGQIYACWGLAESATDEKVARTRAAIILHSGRLISWDEEGVAYTMDAQGKWEPFNWE